MLGGGGKETGILWNFILVESEPDTASVARLGTNAPGNVYVFVWDYLLTLISSIHTVHVLG